MEMLQSALIMRDAFVTFVYGFGDQSELGNVKFTWLTMPVLSGIGKFNQLDGISS